MYVLKGQALQPRGSKHGCDPYLKVKLGKTVIDDRKSHLTDTREPFFHRGFEMRALFPGVSTLEVHAERSEWDAPLASNRVFHVFTLK